MFAEQPFCSVLPFGSQSFSQSVTWPKDHVGSNTGSGSGVLGRGSPSNCCLRESRRK